MIARTPEASFEQAEAGLYMPTLSTLRRVETLTETEKLFEIELPGGHTLGHQPGQFVEISLFGYGEAPISICSAAEDGDFFQLCIRRAGTLTGALHQLQAGAQVGIRGPYGKGFPVEEMAGKDLLARESISRKLRSMRRELEGHSASTLERLLVDRVGSVPSSGVIATGASGCP